MNVQKILGGNRVTVPSRFKVGELVIVKDGKNGSLIIIPAKAIPKAATTKAEQ